VGAIVGGVIGALFGVVIIGAIIYYFVWRKKQREAKEQKFSIELLPYRGSTTYE
jgi:preprotein translocase subunit YajC